MNSISVNVNVWVDIRLKDKGNLLANANISISSSVFGRVTIKNFQIWQSKEFNRRLNAPINISPPANKFRGKYHYVIFFESDEVWLEIENIIYEEYCKKRKSNSERHQDSIDNDEIDRGMMLKNTNS